MVQAGCVTRIVVSDGSFFTPVIGNQPWMHQEMGFPHLSTIEKDALCSTDRYIVLLMQLGQQVLLAVMQKVWFWYKYVGLCRKVQVGHCM